MKKKMIVVYTRSTMLKPLFNVHIQIPTIKEDYSILYHSF